MKPSAIGQPIRLIAKMPTIVAAFERMRHGNEPVRPRDDLSHAANFLWMLNEEEPDPLDTRIMDVCLILHAEHTMNASTFSGLVVGSTEADPYTMVSSAIGALTGPLHGGANEQALKMFQEIGTVDNAKPFIEARLAAKQKIMGMGHRVYKVKDPRANALQGLALKLFEAKGEHPLYKVAQEVEKIISERVGAKGDCLECRFLLRRGLRQAGYSPSTSSPRSLPLPGWPAGWPTGTSSSRTIVSFRPTQVYTGSHASPYISSEQRS